MIFAIRHQRSVIAGAPLAITGAGALLQHR
jgi:hypothetical protein